MYVLSREASAVLKDGNNECRGVSRGRSSRSRAELGEVRKMKLIEHDQTLFENESTVVCRTTRTVVREVGKCEKLEVNGFMNNIYLLPNLGLLVR